MRDINWERVFVASILGSMLILSFYDTSYAGAWDPRDPEVVRVQGTVEGVNIYTVGWMRSFSAKAEAWHRQARPNELGAGGERGTKAAYALRDLKVKFAGLEVYAKGLKSDPAVGTAMRPGDPKLKKLDELIAAANEPMFALMRLMAQAKK